MEVLEVILGRNLIEAFMMFGFLSICWAGILWIACYFFGIGRIVGNKMQNKYLKKFFNTGCNECTGLKDQKILPSHKLATSFLQMLILKIICVPLFVPLALFLTIILVVE